MHAWEIFAAELLELGIFRRMLTFKSYVYGLKPWGFQDAYVCVSVYEMGGRNHTLQLQLVPESVQLKCEFTSRLSLKCRTRSTSQRQASGYENMRCDHGWLFPRESRGYSEFSGSELLNFL